ncbi:hypothetical protein OH802_06405 [Nocardioides sp. NBC_00850]|uniref:hypothetical protein n=1 Tax=Nocardioides sp. NBC_00850 TaxID=2976001 RepID=UPI003864AEB9|nr:hypothetical protein OH802_06405 [Nocardioides sp. NBC_00850]
MAGSHSSGVDEALVNKIKQVLTEAKDDVYKAHVDKPGSGDLGGSATAGALEKLMNLATERINSTLSQTNTALIDFIDGLDNAVRAVKNADEEAEAAFRTQLTSAVDQINRPFFENLGKDGRLNLPDVPIPFFPSSEALETAASRAELGQDQEANK